MGAGLGSKTPGLLPIRLGNPRVCETGQTGGPNGDGGFVVWRACWRFRHSGPEGC